MIFGMYSIKDELSGYAFPIPWENETLAERHFKMQNKENSLIKNNYKDFSLWKIGEFDTETGFITNYSEKDYKLICRGIDYDTKN